MLLLAQTQEVEYKYCIGHNHELDLRPGLLLGITASRQGQRDKHELSLKPWPWSFDHFGKEPKLWSLLRLPGETSDFCVMFGQFEA